MSMRKLFFVSREMCGGDHLPADFDLEEFCERLQGKVTDVEIVPVDDSSGLRNASDDLVSAHLFNEALGEYCPR
jgi:hypothetical protein